MLITEQISTVKKYILEHCCGELKLSECHHYCYTNINHSNILLSNATLLIHTPSNNKAYHTLITPESMKRLSLPLKMKIFL